ncbi:Rossmann-fold NAD(P)-binding domain-containing protein [Sphingomonas sp. YL-JM2C]
MKTALVIGGTAASGVAIVAGLRARGYQVTIYHRGTHELAELDDLEHIHGDPHHPDTIDRDLGRRSWDVTIATYGRIRFLADALAGRTGHFVSISGTPVLGAVDGVPTTEDAPYERQGNEPSGMGRLLHRIAETEQAVLASGRGGAFAATVIRYPYVYGPYAVAPLEWHVIQRVLDRRRRWIVQGAGLVLNGRCASPNAAEFALRALDHREASAGQIYNAADTRQYALVEWIQAIAARMDWSFEFVDIPAAIAPLGNTAVPLAGEYSWMRRGDVEQGLLRHQLIDNRKARREIDYRDVVDPIEWLGHTVDHWLAHPPTIDGVDGRLSPAEFDYAAEDALLAFWDGVVWGRPAVGRQLVRAHPYAHPKPAA